MNPQSITYESMGTQWMISVWDLPSHSFETLATEIQRKSHEFDMTYSRFIPSSLVWELSKKTGVVQVPHDLVRMLRMYKQLYEISEGIFTPLLGFTLEDLGYDTTYSLTQKPVVRPPERFDEAMRIIDDTHISLNKSVLIDLGALGKGYFVDTIAAYLSSHGSQKFLVNGSGDIAYKGDNVIDVGLEHPLDATKVIGSIQMRSGSMCSSGGNRRTWRKYHHMIDPDTLTSPDEILATWVIAPITAISDALATCLFFVAPEQLEPHISFEYCILNKDMRIKYSPGFTAEFY